MNPRLWLLLMLLEGSEYISGADLAMRLQVSSRTVRNDIKQINNFFHQDIAQIISKTHVGYHLVIENRDAYSEIRRQGMLIISGTSENRSRELLQRLLISENTLKIDDFCEEMFISRSVVAKDIQKVKKYLEKYHLCLEHSRSRGMYLTGSELNKRLCLADIIEEDITAKNRYADGWNQMLKESHYIQLREIGKSLLANEKFFLSEDAFERWILHLCICIIRSCNSKFVFFEQKTLSKLATTSEFEIASKLSEILKLKLDVDLPFLEVSYICLYLCGMKTVKLTSDNLKNLAIDQEIFEMVTEMIEQLKITFQVDLRDNIDFLLSLCCHMIPLVVRAKHNMWMKNLLLDEIKTKYAPAFLMTQNMMTVFEEKYGVRPDDNEVGFITLHVNLALQKERIKIGRKVLVVCSSGRGSAELLKYQVLNRFRESITRVDVIDLVELNESKASEYDYIFTTVKIDCMINKPIILMNKVLSTKDLNDIQDEYNRNIVQNYLKYIPKNMFFSHLEFGSKEELLKYLCRKIHEKMGVNEEALINSIMRRESMGTTALGNLVAIPHPAEIMMKESFVCIAILNKAISWNDIKVQFVFMLLLGEEQKENLYEFYDITAALLANNVAIKEMIRLKNYEAFANCIQYIMTMI